MAYESRDYSLKLTAGVEFPFRGVRGKFYRLKETSVAGAKIFIQFDESGSFTPLQQGDWGEVPSYDKIRFLSPIDVEVTFYLGNEMQRSDRAEVSIASVTATFEENNGGASPADVNIVSGATSVISPARGTKREVIVGNPSTNTSSFRVGNVAAAGTGFLLEPGMSIGFDGSMAISAHNEGAVTEALTVTELDRI